jgi:riboflavin biosynthesis pyrimidine reductase
MVEGGARVISSFLQQAEDTLDLLVVTVAPIIIDGQRVAALGGLGGAQKRSGVMLTGPRVWSVGPDTIILGRPTVAPLKRLRE